MDSLYQRLRELDPDTFQRLCFHILKDRHPGANICQVGGASGDEGLDVYSGLLARGSTIWQCKSFALGVRKSQKEQIRQSLKRAIKSFSPAIWVLCISVELDAKAHRWFQRLQESYRAVVTVGLFSAPDIVHELLHRKAIRDHFFPGASLDPTELKKILSRTGELSMEELEAINDGNLGDYIERFKARDARCDYEIVFGNHPESDVGQGTGRPGLMLSFTDSNKSVNVYSRDEEALKADPPKISFTIKGTGVEKFITLVRKGIAQEFSSAEVQGITTNWALLEPLRGAKGYKLIVKPSVWPRERTIKARLVFGSGTSAVEYGFIEFSPARIGADEVELVSVADSLPFRFSFVLPLTDQGNAHWTFDERFVGRKVRDVQKFMNALTQLVPSGILQVYDLEREREIFCATPSMSAETVKQQHFRELIDDLVAIETRFKVQLLMPQDFTEEDLETLALLKAYAEGGSMALNDISVVLTKSGENQNTVPSALGTPGRLRFRNENPQARFLGALVNVGPAEMCTDHSVVNDLESTIIRFKEANIGDGVPISFKPLGPVRFSLL
jgi:hypothetical protein